MINPTASFQPNPFARPPLPPTFASQEGASTPSPQAPPLTPTFLPGQGVPLNELNALGVGNPAIANSVDPFQTLASLQQAFMPTPSTLSPLPSGNSGYGNTLQAPSPTSSEPTTPPAPQTPSGFTLQAPPGAQVVQTPYGYNVMGPQNLLTAFNPLDPRIDFVNPTIQAAVAGGAIGTALAVRHAWQPQAQGVHNYRVRLNGQDVFLQSLESQQTVKNIYSDAPNKGLIATFEDTNTAFWGKGKQAQKLNRTGNPYVPSSVRLLNDQGQTAYTVRQLKDGALQASNPYLQVQLNADGFITHGTFKHQGQVYNVVQDGAGQPILEESTQLGQRLKRGVAGWFNKAPDFSEAQTVFKAQRQALMEHKALGVVQQAGDSLKNLQHVKDLGVARNGFDLGDLLKSGAKGAAALAGVMLVWQGGKWALQHGIPQWLNHQQATTPTPTTSAPTPTPFQAQA
ncbi:MAG: hypothetical protein ACKO34_05860 [Vampirovibrionales bacterium]